MKRFLLIPIGFGAAAIGLFGLIVPVIPGVLFLLVAMLCFATALPRLRTRLSRSPRFARLFRRMDHSAQLPAVARLKLTFWALLEAVTPTRANHR
ncbi:MAG: DUF454 family protein [Pseudomonadales bacterium]